jgi:hypothetical protein
VLALVHLAVAVAMQAFERKKLEGLRGRASFGGGRGRYAVA